MAIIRMAASTGAALIALMALVQTTSQAQAPKAPLQLVPGPNQAKIAPPAAITKKTPKAVAKTSGKATKTAASNKTSSSRQNTAAARPSAKTARANPKSAADTVASRRQSQTTTNLQRARAATGQRATRTAAVAPRVAQIRAAPVVAAARPMLRREAPAPQIFAHGPDSQAPEDHVMRGRDSISLVAMLPWWRNDRLEAVHYGSAEAESQVMAAADAWLAANGGKAEAGTASRRTFALAPADDAIEVADAAEINDIDLAAGPVQSPPNPSFLQSLLALLGGAAIAAAASARLLFV